MKYGRRSQTNGQQAPIGRFCTLSRQALRSVPVHTASKNTKRSRSGMIHSASSTIRRVRTILNGDENRFSRTQPIGPDIEAGGGCCSSVCWRTKRASAIASSPSDIVMARPSPFHQLDAAVVDIHQQRRDQADEEIDQLGDG